jgi:hypothetical protein
MTMLLHRFPNNIPDDKLQETDMSYLFSSEAALRSLAENSVGPPFQRSSPDCFEFDPEQIARPTIMQNPPAVP